MEAKRANSRIQSGSQCGLLLAAFGLSAGMALLLYILRGIAPFGDNTLVFTDAYTQYIRFAAYIRDVFLGKQDLFYALEKTIGGNVVGLLAYYLASPFNLLYLLFPEEKLTLAFHLIILLKLSGCGLTMAVFFKHTEGLDAKSLLFTTAYAFCGYNTAFFWSIMWLDGVLMLPLVALGLKKIFAEKKPWLYLVSLAGAIIFNYYIGYMLCIFSVLYAMLLVWNSTENLREIGWKSIGVFFLSSLAAGGLSAFILLPGLLSMANGKASTFRGVSEWYYLTHTQRLLDRFFPGNNADYMTLVRLGLAADLIFAALIVLAVLFVFMPKRVNNKIKIGALLLLLLYGLAIGIGSGAGGLFFYKFLEGNTLYTLDELWENRPNVYIGLLPLMLSIGYFMNRDIPSRERKGAFAVFFVLFFSMYLVVPNIVWHGMTDNDNFNFRYSFIMSFFLLTLAKQSMDRVSALRPVHWGLIMGAIAVLILQSVKQGRAAAQPSVYGMVLGVSLLFGLVFTVCALRGAAARNGRGYKSALAALAVVHLLNLFMPAYLTLADFQARNTEDNSQSAFALSVQAANRAIDTVSQVDSGLFRARLDEAINGPIQYGYNGVSHFSSTEQREVVELMQKLGLVTFGRIWASSTFGSTRALDSLFGVKYLTGGTYTGDYECIGDSLIYVNRYALPMAFPADGGLAGVTLKSNDPFANLNRFYKALYPELDRDVFTAAAAEQAGITGLEAVGEFSYAVSPGEEYGEIRYTVDISSADPLCLYIEEGDGHTEKIYVNGNFAHEWADDYYRRIVYLGSFQPGEQVQISLRLESGAWQTLMDKPLFYYESGEALAAYQAALTAQPCRTESETDSQLSTRVEITREGQSLLYTIPYEPDWQVLVDGEEAEAVKGLGLFLTVPLPPGEHVVELRYTPPGLYAGAVISAVTATFVAAAVVLSRRKEKRI